jgi:flagellar basal body-associated protein FliL
MTPPSRGLLITYRTIVALILFLVMVIISGSLYAILRPANSGPLFRIGKTASGSGGAEGGDSETSGSTVNVFNGIGRLRIPVAGQAGSTTMLLSIAFPYPPGDRPFTEELASCIGNFRSIARDYFSSLPPEQIRNLDEAAAKTEILRRYNTLLRLGKIEVLYFSDLMIIE